MAQSKEAVNRKWEPVPSNERVWEPVPSDSRVWEPAPADKPASVAPANPAIAPVPPVVEPDHAFNAAERQLAPSLANTPAEQAEDEARNRTPANLKDLDKNISTAATPEIKRTLEAEKARIAAPVEAAGPAPTPQLPAAPVPATFDKNYDTILTPGEEQQYGKWKAKYAPHDSGADYDLRGAFKAGIKPNSENGHFPDTYKKPNHPTFSDQSNYAQFGPHGRWEGEKFIPPARGTLHLPKKPTAAIRRPPVTIEQPAPKKGPLVEKPRAPRELTALDTVPGFVFEDFIPGAIEGQAKGIANFATSTAAALPALAGAAVSGGRKGEGDFIDRFKELHGDIAGKMELKPETATGQHSMEVQSRLVEAGLDAVGSVVAGMAGPFAGAWVKGSLAALAGVAGAQALRGKTARPIERVNEPRFDPLSTVTDPRQEPKMGTVSDLVAEEVDVTAKPMTAEQAAAFDRDNPPEPAMGNIPQIPIPRAEKPRIRLTPEQVTGRILPGPEISTPAGSSEPIPAAADAPSVPGTGARDAQLDAPVQAGLFKMPAEASPQETAAPTTASPSVEGQLPQPPQKPAQNRTPGEAKGNPDGYTLPDPESEYVASHSIDSDVREEGQQRVKVPQTILWAGPTGKIDRLLFKAGKQFKTASTDPKVVRDATANKEAAFNQLQESVRYMLLEDASVPEAAKAPYRALLTDDGTQVSRDKLMRAAVGYNVKVSTELFNARKSRPGQAQYVIEGSKWSGEVPPAAAPKAPPEPKPGNNPVSEFPRGANAPQLPQAPPAEPTAGKLPKDLAKSAPRYNYGDSRFELTFANDVDRAAYITAQTTRSKRDADFVKFVRKETGMSEEEVRAYGADVRAQIKRQAKAAIDAGEVDPKEAFALKVDDVERSTPQVDLKKKNVGNDNIDYNNDTLTTGIARLGSIDVDAMLDTIGEGKVKDAQGKAGLGKATGIARVFKKGGMSFDKMLETLGQHGFIPPDALKDVDGGTAWLKSAISDEMSGNGKYWSSKADEDVIYGRMREEEAGARGEDFEPGTFGANPFMNPAALKGALKTVANLLDKGTKPMRGWFNAAQAMKDQDLGALGVTVTYAEKVSAAKYLAEIDIARSTNQPTVARDFNKALLEAIAVDPKYVKRPWVKMPTTLRQAIQQTELARRQVAKLELQRELIGYGYASPVPLKGYSQLKSNMADLTTSSGRQLYIKDNLHPLMDQMVGAHDVMQAADRADWRNPLSAAEMINQGTVGLIMYNPVFHTVTVAGRVAPFAANRLGTNSVLFKMGEAAGKLKDRDFMYNLIKERGYQPMRMRESQAALGGQMGKLEKFFKDTGLSKPYEFYRALHNNVMVGAVNHMQMSFYLMKVEDFLKEGMPRDAAETAAARMSNMIGGNLPKHEMQQVWHQILGGSLFSRGYTSTVIRQATSAITKDKVLMAKLAKAGHTPASVAKAVDAYREDLAKALILDYAAMQITGNAINYAMTLDNKTEDRHGKKGPHFTWDNIPRDGRINTKPTKAELLFPDRIAIGQSKDGKPAYIENPLRTVRDMILFFAQGKELAAGEKPTWLNRKLGTLPGVAMDSLFGKDAMGRPLKDAIDVTANVGNRMTPFDFKNPAEAIRMNSMPYFTDALKGALADPSMMGLKVIGLQPHTEVPDPTTSAASTVNKEQNKVWSEAAEIRKNWKHLGSQARKDALERLTKIGQPWGIKAQTLERYVESEGASKSQRKKVNKAAGGLETE